MAMKDAGIGTGDVLQLGDDAALAVAEGPHGRPSRGLVVGQDDGHSAARRDIGQLAGDDLGHRLGAGLQVDLLLLEEEALQQAWQRYEYEAEHDRHHQQDGKEQPGAVVGEERAEAGGVLGRVLVGAGHSALLSARRRRSRHRGW